MCEGGGGAGVRAFREAGMRTTFPLFIVSRCLCFTRPGLVLATHDKAAKGGITEGTYNVMYYT